MSNSPVAGAMTSIPMNQLLEDKFLHWRYDMERKQEEQARQMKELQGQAERLRSRMTGWEPRLKKVIKTHKITTVMLSRSPVIKGRDLLFLTTSIP